MAPIIYPASGGTVAQAPASQPPAGGNPSPVTFTEGETAAQTPFGQLQSGKGQFAESVARNIRAVEFSSGGNVSIASPYVARNASGEVSGPQGVQTRGQMQLASGSAQQVDVAAYNAAYGTAGAVNRELGGQQYVVVTQEQGGGYVVATNPNIQAPPSLTSKIRDLLTGSGERFVQSDKGFVVGGTPVAEKAIANINAPEGPYVPIFARATPGLPQAPSPPSVATTLYPRASSSYIPVFARATPEQAVIVPKGATPAEAVKLASEAAQSKGAIVPGSDQFIQTPVTRFFSSTFNPPVPVGGPLGIVLGGGLFVAKGIESSIKAELAIPLFMKAENVAARELVGQAGVKLSQQYGIPQIAQITGLVRPTALEKQTTASEFASSLPYVPLIPILAVPAAKGLLSTPTAFQTVEQPILRETVYGEGQPIASRVGLKGTEAFRDILSKNYGVEYFQNVPGVGEVYIQKPVIDLGLGASRAIVAPGAFTGTTVETGFLEVAKAAPGLSLKGFIGYGLGGAAIQAGLNVYSGRPIGEKVPEAFVGGAIAYPAFEAVSFASTLPKAIPTSEIVTAPGFQKDIAGRFEFVPMKDVRGFYQEQLPAGKQSDIVVHEAYATPSGPKESIVRPLSERDSGLSLSELRDLYPGFKASPIERGGSPISVGPGTAQIALVRPQEPVLVQPQASRNELFPQYARSRVKVIEEENYLRLPGEELAPIKSTTQERIVSAPAIGQTLPVFALPITTTFPARAIQLETPKITDLTKPGIQIQPPFEIPKFINRYLITSTETSLQVVPPLTSQLELQQPEPPLTRQVTPEPSVVFPSLPAIGFPILFPPPKVGGGGEGAISRGARFPAKVLDLLTITGKIERKSVVNVQRPKVETPRTRQSGFSFAPASIQDPFARAKKKKK